MMSYNKEKKSLLEMAKMMGERTGECPFRKSYEDQRYCNALWPGITNALLYCKYSRNEIINIGKETNPSSFYKCGLGD